MTKEELLRLLGDIRNVRTAVVGDFCLDAYLHIDTRAPEVSLETGLPTRAVIFQRYSPGGAGNVACNLRAMGVETIALFGIIGADPFGEELLRTLHGHGMNTAALLTQRSGWDTHVYMKPIEKEQEARRIDFGSFNAAGPREEEQLLEELAQALPFLDLVIVKEQVPRGLLSGRIRAALRTLAEASPGKVFVADSRHYADDFGPMARLVAPAEASRIAGGDGGGIEEMLGSLSRRWGAPVFLPRPRLGCAFSDGGEFEEIPGMLFLSRLDTVGAGDSMLSGIAAALAAGAPLVQAAELGTVVAGVTAQKILETGTATPEEILQLGTDTDRVYRPEIAADTRGALYLEGTEIEIVTEPPSGRNFTHLIFDHDGTISTLRQGWEEIMEPMMVGAILGGEHPGGSLEEDVICAVREFIDKTTGIQTLVQMQGLVELVRRFRCVKKEEILDAHGYKALYNRSLLEMVEERIGRLRRGELGLDDFTIRGAVPLLEAVRGRGALLFLASGTDQADVERESSTLGYRDLFGPRIYGAVGDITREAKRIVLERIMRDIGPGAPAQTLTFGDGPVEIRETHKRGGYAVGVASDEVKRSGLNRAKRKRLIEAGADLIIPDYFPVETLLRVLFGA